MLFYKTLDFMHFKKMITIIENEDGEGLLWGKPIFDNYIVPAAYCIMCHNIFCAFSNTIDGQKYQLIGLEKLVIKRHKSIIRPSHHPLLFLLCLLDTLEPVKIFSGDKPISPAQVDQILKHCEPQTDNGALHISWNPNEMTIGACRTQCQYRQDTGNCDTYSCLRTIANNLEFLISDKCQVSVDEKWLKISINA